MQTEQTPELRLILKLSGRMAANEALLRGIVLQASGLDKQRFKEFVTSLKDVTIRPEDLARRPVAFKEGFGESKRDTIQALEKILENWDLLSDPNTTSGQLDSIL